MFTGVNKPTVEKNVIKQSGDSGGSSVVSLVNGILGDSLNLVKQHLELFVIEIRSDYRKMKDAALYLACGIGLCLPGIILFGLMLVHLLHALASPSVMDHSSIPLWACYGIVGALLALPGLLLGYTGVKKFQSCNPLPDETVRRLFESWHTNGSIAPRGKLKTDGGSVKRPEKPVAFE